ncbi:MAG: tRNA (pseudouridine(54)-N(1))-methyltransferase TrmY, partial [Thermoplasmata archaeon]|nr:tRNA (pseudouridine(54)-N(1))-methyltransferase TrmY [Thermoplasmata archaeon]NIS10864.1 tRNA (pseudouridine(54)-N(1))-methyltransferase TrmY [Thermoplasmata archaeon]NIS18798.1 tRNA (pseudouridine(54)-N(1))-methyltransferase TrmY [Thermoplasmata archaeon]NIT75823.1 tRNA (pseudouridine(54)-N(1))-methyltransferase TrmY [Thermoplasmata archaeon]NIU47959.1 tRNA (pseudouridine(54)-N(1))-methyltransferase TrmY [Thermoplasmata archaeon]
MRRFVVVGQNARTASDFPLDDICGAAGRWDLLARCVQGSLFIAHDLRRDAELILVVLGEPDPPKAIRVSGETVRNLNPDERSTVALLSRALDERLPRNGRWIQVQPGIHVARKGLAQVLDEVPDVPLVLLDEDADLTGSQMPSRLEGDEATFVLGDNNGLTDEQFSEVRSRGA